MRVWGGTATAIILVSGVLGASVPFDDAAKPERTVGATEHDRPLDTGWPAIEDAVIRPGVRLESSPASAAGIECTANFVFSAPDNATLFIGAASHCLAGRVEGDSLAVAGIPNAGIVAYCSYRHVLNTETCADAPQPAGLNDWALIQIEPAYRHLVHPAVLHWGGPTGLVGPPTSEGSTVRGYGNSSLKPEPSLSPFEGVVVQASEPTTHALGVMPGVPGDSGGPLLDQDGRALAVLQRPSTSVPGAVQAVNLAPILSYMTDETGLLVTLQTWQPTDAAAPRAAGSNGHDAHRAAGIG